MFSLTLTATAAAGLPPAPASSSPWIPAQPEFPTPVTLRSPEEIAALKTGEAVAAAGLPPAPASSGSQTAEANYKEFYKIIYRQNLSSAQKGDAAAQGRCINALYNLAKLAQEARQPEKAGQYFTSILKVQELVKAKLYLAKMYDQGIGVKQNEMEALQLMNKAAELGDLQAQKALGAMYAKLSARWLERAASAERPDATKPLQVTTASEAAAAAPKTP